MGSIIRGVKNAFRNSIRTLAIILILGISIGLSVIMFLSYKTVNNKIASVQGSIGNVITITPAGFGGGQGGGNPLTTDQLSFISSTPHVTGVVETLQDRLQPTTDTNLQSSIDAGELGKRAGNFQSRQFSGGSGTTRSGSTTTPPANFTIPISVTGTNDPTGKIASSDKMNITSGAAFADNSTDNVALVGKDLATKNNLTVGSTFTAYSKTITVVGIYDTGNTFSNSNLTMPLATLQTLSSQATDVTTAVVGVDSINNTSATVTAIQAKLTSDIADVTSSQDASNSALAPLENIKNTSLYSLVGALIAGSVVILMTLVMIVRERRREIGIMKAIGSSDTAITVQFMSESLVLTLLGSALGIVLGAIFSNPVLKVLVNSASTTTTTATNATGGPGGAFGGGARQFVSSLGLNSQSIKNLSAVVDWHIILYGLGAAIAIAIIGSAMPATIIAKIRPVEAMRGE